MTVKELKKQIANIPEDLEVCFNIEDWDGEYDFITNDRGIIDSTFVGNSTVNYMDEEYLKKRNSNVLIIKGRTFQSIYYKGSD